MAAGSGIGKASGALGEQARHPGRKGDRRNARRAARPAMMRLGLEGMV